ncbi:dystroglycan 1-like [Glandiceps talaboti]
MEDSRWEFSEEIRISSEHLPSTQRHSTSMCTSRNTVSVYAAWMCSNHNVNRSKMYRLSASRTFKGSLLVLTVLSLLTVCVNGESNNVPLNLGANIIREETPARGNARLVSVWRGVPDTVANVGKVFKYSIPSDAFTGDISSYEVNEAGGGGLPSWLSFDKTTQTLEGIPTHEDINQYYLALTAHGSTPNGTVKATDVFSVNIASGPSIESVSATPLKDYNKSGRRKCSTEEPEALATIILDADWSKMSPKERVNSVMRMAEYSGFERNVFQLLPAGKNGLFDPAALVAGPGNIKKQNYPGILLSWPIGCGYDVNKLPVVMVIESTSKDGALAENIGHNVIGWHITHPHPSGNKRMKRQIAAMATPVPTAVPTKPVPTSVVPTSTSEVESTAVPSGITVPPEPTPVMSQPVRTATKVAPTKSMTPTVKPTDTKVRTPSASPTRKVPPKSKTASMMTHIPMPTPTPVPTRLTMTATTEGPSRTYSPPMPTVTETEGLTAVPEMTTMPSKSEGMLPPSATYIEPTPSATITVPKESEKPSEPNKKNRAPTVANGLDLLEAHVGQRFEFQVPSNTFRDKEDGNTRDLDLMVFKKDGTNLDSNSWLQFDTEDQILYGTPETSDVGSKNYFLLAKDSRGKNARDYFEIKVTKENELPELLNQIDKLNAVEGVMLVYRIPEDIFNDPEDGPTRNLKLMVLHPDGVALSESSWLQFDPQDQTLKGTPTKSDVGSHQYVLEAIDSSGGSMSVSFEIEVKMQTTPSTVSNQPPVLLNPIDKVYAYQGSMLNYRIREDEFHDAEDGNTRNLKLMFLTLDGVVMRQDSWVQFDSENQTLYGLPMEEQLGIHVFLMAAMDKGGKVARDAFEIEVLPSAHKPNHEFRIVLENDFKEFEENIHKKTDLVNRIAGLYGDTNANSISILYFKKGSTIFAWTNNSIPYTPCPLGLIGEMTGKVVNNTKGEPTQGLIDALGEEYKVREVNVTPVGPCSDTPTGTTEEPVGPGIGGSASAMSEEVLWIKIMIPFLVVGVALLVGGLIFFLLYRVNRKGKLSDEDQNTFIKKGIPIIFAGELEDTEKPPSSKTPLIMKDEKPPLPPEYQRQDSPNSSQPLLSQSPPDHERDEDDDPSGSPPYQRPPPFSSSPPETRSSRPRFTPAYRAPPPYVPP